MYMHTNNHHAILALPDSCHSLTRDMCCSLDSLIGDCLPDIALLAGLIVHAVEVNLFAESLSPLDVPHLQAKYVHSITCSLQLRRAMTPRAWPHWYFQSCSS